MVARREQIFLTGEVAELVGIPEWRVVKIATGEEYGIKPRRSAKGSGSRRVYDIENVCEIALAVRLLETGLRPKVIGDVIAKLRGKLSSTLKIASVTPKDFYLVVGREAEIGRPLNQSRPQRIKFLEMEDEVFHEQLQDLWTEMSENRGPDVDMLFVAVGPFFREVHVNLERMKAEGGK
jgi:DNA-binding transcriptional MerR regulator